MPNAVSRDVKLLLVELQGVTSADYVSDAHRIGRMLERRALWSGPLCTWPIHFPNPTTKSGRPLIGKLADGCLYYGTAGVALFLGLLEREAPSAKRRRVINGALDHCWDWIEREHTPVRGLCMGALGSAYAMARVADVCANELWAERARTLLTRICEAPITCEAPGIVTGAAGVILGLLDLGSAFRESRALERAVELGERLLGLAHLLPDGWSWSSWPIVSARAPCGYAYGAAGVGHAFLELFAATRLDQFRYAAEQAFAYERSQYEPGEGAWRHYADTTLLRREYKPADEEGQCDGGDSVVGSHQARLAWTPSYSWAFGTAGIVLARLRASQILGKTTLGATVPDAVANLRRAAVTSDLSLASGAAGHADALLVAGTLADISGWCAAALDVAERCRAEVPQLEREWDGHHRTLRADASLFSGVTGVGYLLLRIAGACDTSVLFLSGHPTKQSNTVHCSGARVVRVAPASGSDMDAWFGVAIAAVHRFAGVPVNWTHADGSARTAREIFTTLNQIVEQAAPAAYRSLLRDALRLARCWIKSEDKHSDVLEPFRTSSLDEIEERGPTLYCLTPGVTLVQTLYAWNEWTSSGAVGQPARTRESFVICQDAATTHVRRVSIFTFEVLSAIQSATSSEEVIRRVATRSGSSIERVAGVVSEQLHAALRARIAECAGSPALRPDLGPSGGA